MAAAENKEVLNQYIPGEEVEELIYRSKHSLKQQIKVLKKRAAIEQRYANSLNEWVVKTKSKVDLDKDYDHKDIRLCLMVSVREGEATALLHEKLASLLTQCDSAQGPISALTAFKNANFKKTTQDIDLLLGREKVSSYLENFIKQYKSTLKGCFDAIKQAEMATKTEIKLEEQLQETVDKMNKLERSNIRMVQYEARMAKYRHNIRDLKSQLDVNQSKRENFLTKAKSIIRRRTPILDSIIESITDVERERIKVFIRAVFKSLELVGILGPEAIDACKTAKELLRNMSPDIMVSEWQETKKTRFKITEKEDMRSKHPSVLQTNIDHLKERLHIQTPPLHLFSVNQKENKQAVAWGEAKRQTPNDAAVKEDNDKQVPQAEKDNHTGQAVNEKAGNVIAPPVLSESEERSASVQFTDRDKFLCNSDAAEHYMKGDPEKQRAFLRKMEKHTDPFQYLSGKCDIKLEAISDYEYFGESYLNLEKGQFIRMKLCHQDYRVGWGWTKGPTLKGPKIYGKFPLFCVDIL